MARFGLVVSSRSSVRPSELRSSFRTLLSPAMAVWSLAAILFFLVGAASAQSDPVAGLIPFSTHVGGPIDSIDLATGNIMLNVPVRSKVGNIPLSFSLIGNFYSAWANEPTTQLSLTMPGGTLFYSTMVVGDCYIGSYEYEVYEASGFSVVDSTGAGHSFGGVEVQYGACLTWGQQIATTVDGSGYTLIIPEGAGASGPVPSVYDRSGDQVGGGQGVLIDPDGVQISTSSQYINNQWVTTTTDTLGQPVLTSTNPSNTQVYTYPGEGSGNPPQTTTISYAIYNWRTNYGCPGHPDYPGSIEWNLPTSIQLPDGETYKLSYEATPGYPADTDGRLVGITLPNGGSISYAYSGTNYGMRCGVNSVTTLTRTVNDGNGHVGTWTYGTSAEASNGESTVTETDPVGNTTTYIFAGEFQTEKIVKDVSLGVLSTSVTCYAGQNTSQAGCISGSYAGNWTAQTDVYTSLGSAPPSLVETQYDIYGNVTSVKRYGVGATYPPSGTPISETDTTYCQPAPYMYDHPCTVTTYSSGTMVARTTYTYNAGGHPVQTQQWVNGSNYLTSSATYNSSGTLTSSTDVNGATTTYSNFTCNGMLPQTTTLPQISGESFQMSSSQTWDCVGGVVTSSTDVNGNPTTYSYDALWRPIQTNFPDEGQTAVAYNFPVTPPNVPNIVVSEKINSAGQFLTTQTNYDGLGRPVRSMFLSDPSGTDYTDTTYNNLGQVYSVSNPYRTTSDPTYGLTYYQYDALGRTLQVTNPDSSTKLMTYAGGATEVQDEGNGSARRQGSAERWPGKVGLGL